MSGMTYRCIMADPPWPERGGGKIKRGADRHYPLMSVNQIRDLPVRWVADDSGSHLYLWTTNNFLLAALEVMSAWGFRYVTNIAWGKVRNDKIQMGLGQYFRGSHELCLFGVRGKQPAIKPALSLMLAPRTKHSRKPAEIFSVAEQVSPGPRLELFSREPREGWDSLGNEVDGRDIASSLLDIAHASLPLDDAGQ